MTMGMDNALTNKTNQYLDTFNNHEFRSLHLKSKVMLTSNPVEKYSQDVTVNGVTTEGGLTLDPTNKDKVEHDLAAYKDYVSELKFAHLELQSKLRCAQRIIDPRGTEFVSISEHDEAEQRRQEVKGELKARKIRVAELEALLRAETQKLEHTLAQRQAEAAHAAQLLRDCEKMELDIAVLKAKRSHADRMTVQEAEQFCNDQCEEMASLTSNSDIAKATIKETKPLIASRKRAVEKLGATKNALIREEQERGSKGVQDARAEEGCRWITHSIAFYKTLQGIKSASSIGSPAKEMRIVYDIGINGKEDERTLSIELGEGGRMTGAKLLESATRVDDIVAAYLPSQDLRMMVQEIRTRISR